MAETHQDLRDHLTAVLEAAQELPREDRSYLADSFLDELERQYQLVPRTPGAPRAEARPARPRFAGFSLGWGPVPIGLAILLAVVLLPVLAMSFLVLVHPPVFLFVLLLLFLFRFARPRGRRGGPWRYGPRGGGMTPYV